MPRRGRGGACCCGRGADDQDGVDASTGPDSMVSESSSASTAPLSLEDARARLTGCTGFTGTGFAPPGTSGRAHGRTGCRILVTVVSTSRLPVVAKLSRARWPSSPTARNCGCLHRGSNAQAVSKIGEAARSHVPMASASCIAPRRARRSTELGKELGRRGSGHRARAGGLLCVRLQHAHRPRARSGRADRSCAACVVAGRAVGGTPGWWVGIGLV